MNEKPGPNEVHESNTAKEDFPEGSEEPDAAAQAIEKMQIAEEAKTGPGSVKNMEVGKTVGPVASAIPSANAETSRCDQQDASKQVGSEDH